MVNKMFIERLSSLEDIEHINACSFANNIARLKGNIIYFKISNIPLESMHILKQEAISTGGDFITSKEAILCKERYYDGILISTLSQINRIIDKCKIQPFELKKVAKILETHINDIKFMPKIMGIINVTDDSFFADSRIKETDKIINKIEMMINSKVDIIDIGAASTRPGSKEVDSNSEIRNLKDALITIKNTQLIDKKEFSIDSYNYETIKFALDNGFTIINDVHGLKDKNIISLIKDYNSKIILMHNSWINPHSNNIIESVDNFFEQRIETLLNKNISKENIIIDVGFGFGKTTYENIKLIKAIPHFKRFGVEILVGASRKQTIGNITNMDIKDRLSGTLSMHQIALQQGASIIRCHDVIEHKNMIDILSNFI